MTGTKLPAGLPLGQVNYANTVNTYMGYPGNHHLALAIREVERLHEASWVEGIKNPEWDNWVNDAITKEPRYWLQEGKYAKSMHDCICEVVGSDPIATILDCLFTAGFADMYDFCDAVLGKEQPDAHP